MRSSRSERLRKDFASVYTPRNDAFSFLTNFFPAQGEPAGLFVPRPAIRFSLPHEGPPATIYGISAAYQGGPFSSGDVAARSALHESRAMQWPRQVRRDECETRSKPAVSIRQSNAA